MAVASASPVNDTPQPVQKTSWMPVVQAVSIISIIVLVEIIVITMLLPSAGETRQIAEKLATASVSGGLEEGELEHDGQQSAYLARNDVREVNLGSYHVVTYNPDTGSSMNVDFVLYGTVLASDESQFQRLYDAHQIRIREQILLTVRGTEVADLSDAQLGLLKRQILEKTNRALGRPLLLEAVFSKFSFIER